MISKQKSRRVTVSDTRFRHKVSTTPKSRGVYDLNITAQSEDYNGSKLVVEGLIQKDSSVWPIACGELEFYPTVTRHEVEWCIREAINHGWVYSTPGPNFILQSTNEIFRLGFWATERAKNPICETNSENKNQANNKGCCEWVSDSEPIRLRP
jgi:hypothetical protein